MSDEEKERRHWETIQANLSHHGFDRSPFVPRTFGEYLVHRLHIVSEAINAARERLRQREEHAELIRRHLSAGTPPEQLPGSLTTPQSLLARAQNSSPPLSPVLARPSIWTNARDSNDSNWPSISELKNAGAARAAKGQSRFFPAPRTNDPDDVFVAGATQNGVRASGSSFPGAAGWDLPSVRRDILTVYEADALDDPTQELGLWELNETIQGLIERIDETE
ncbi:hypothetical protein F5Y14DRAFT_350140 [Nemania sp. NC0429]|nr:hypothetical protein F5Y14DRAFT_350140 [Nemania sp. NC0429]